MEISKVGSMDYQWGDLEVEQKVEWMVGKTDR